MGFLNILQSLQSLGRAIEQEAAKYDSTRTNPQTNTSAPAQNAAPSYTQTPAQAYEDDAAGDCSWGDYMPRVPNQYNYNGTYIDYFEEIFRAELPGYTFNKEHAQTGERLIYTFTGAAGTALVVELMSDRCDARKVRNACQAAGTPYLRFYIDHRGWWNTRDYVAGRLHAAIGA